MSIVAPHTVTAATGLPETRLPESLLGQLPGSVAPAPWRTRCSVVTWLHPVDATGLDAFPDPIRPERIALVAWALVRYDETPVGPYREIAATLIPEGGDGYGHIPFIVVDSLPSIVGGRTNWLLPKALARFESSEDGHVVTATSDQPADPAWSITVRHRAAGESSPLTIPNHVQQVSIDGAVHRFEGEMSGTMTGATVDVDGHADGPLSALFKPGRYDGSVVTDCRFDVGPLNT